MLYSNWTVEGVDVFAVMSAVVALKFPDCNKYGNRNQYPKPVNQTDRSG